MLEEGMHIETGGDYHHAPEGDPWEPEVIVEQDYGKVLVAFLLGVLIGAAIVLIFTVK